MLNAIKDFFGKHLAPEHVEPVEGGGGPPAPETGHDPVHVAACALLLELAHADQHFTDHEQAHLEDALFRHFGLETDTARELIRLADEERKQAVDLYQFTSLIASSYDDGQKLLLAEIMWRLVLSDGELAKHEDYLMRKVSKLLDLKPGYLAEAHKKALKKKKQ